MSYILVLASVRGLFHDWQVSPRKITTVVSTTINTRHLLLFWLSLLLGHGVQGQTADVRAYAGLPEVAQFRLSPDGTWLAAKMATDGKQALVTRSVSGDGDHGVIRLSDYLISNFVWANNQRLVLTIRGSVAAPGGLWHLNRLASATRYGEEVRGFKMNPNSWGIYRQNPYLVTILPHEPDYVLAALNDGQKWNAPDISKVNIVTGHQTRYLRNRHAITNWLADHNGHVGLGMGFSVLPNRKRGTLLATYLRNEDKKLIPLQKQDYFDHDLLMPVRFHPSKANILLVANAALAEAYADDIDPVLFEYDLPTQTLQGRHVDPMLAKIRQLAGKELGNLHVTIESKALNVPRYVVAASSDTVPPRYYLYDDRQPGFHLLGRAYPGLEGLQHSQMQRVQYTARDGLQIPAYLTRPLHTEQPPPLVVYPHGGPWSRDRWGFDNYVQFLASRGYAVFQPQFRGSTGLGPGHEAAGYGEWGKAIQDDITDGVEWLVNSGQVDAGRICIFGASFGGYAAAMGAAKTPDLYRCAVSVNGVLDLKRLWNSARRMLYEQANRKVWNSRKEAEATSPYHLIPGIKAPMLIIAGTKDTVVPYKDHSRRFYKKLHKQVPGTEYLELENGEHWRTNAAHELEKMQALEAFLARHLGTAAR